MESISSIVDKFKIKNPTADDSVIIAYLKNLGHSNSDIKNYFYDEIEKSIESVIDDDFNERHNDCAAMSMPDISDPFDFPDDIKGELRRRE